MSLVSNRCKTKNRRNNASQIRVYRANVKMAKTHCIHSKWFRFLIYLNFLNSFKIHMFPHWYVPNVHISIFGINYRDFLIYFILFLGGHRTSMNLSDILKSGTSAFYLFFRLPWGFHFPSLRLIVLVINRVGPENE